MRRIEVLYLAAVLLFAALFVGLTLAGAREALIPAGPGEFVGAGAAGQPRDVDLEHIRELIRRQRLSDHEAEFYKPATESPAPPSTPPAGEEKKER
jgi:hypothetical protein